MVRAALAAKTAPEQLRCSRETSEIRRADLLEMTAVTGHGTLVASWYHGMAELDPGLDFGGR